jgi:sugar (pentulose or hexulose) kinase
MYTIGIDVGTTNCKVCLFQVPSLDLIEQYSFRTPKLRTEKILILMFASSGTGYFMVSKR